LRTKNWLRFVNFNPDRSADLLAVEVGGQIHIGRQISRRRDRVRLAPQGCRDRERIDLLAPPPNPLIATSMELAVVQPANRDGEAVANSASHRPLLGKLDVVGIGGGAAADQARLSGNKLEVFAVALTHRFADDRDLVRTGLATPLVCFPVLW